MYVYRTLSAALENGYSYSKSKGVYVVSNSYCMVNCVLAYLLLESRGREAPEGECNKEPMHS